MSALGDLLHKIVDILPLHSEEVQKQFHALVNDAEKEAVPATDSAPEHEE